MAGEKSYKRLQLPKGLKRAEIVPKDRESYNREFDYDNALEADFEEHRAMYTEVIILGLPVKVKVTTTTK